MISPPTAHSPQIQRLIQQLRTPTRVQAWLRTLDYNHEQTMYTLPSVVQRGRAHCLEGALCAAELLEHHGYPPLILDLESADLLDHTLFIFQQGKKWGSVGMSRDIGLHGRQPMFQNIESLARSYAIPYIDQRAEIQAFGVLDLRELSRDQWRTTKQNVWYVENALRAIPHRDIRLPSETVRRWRERHRRFKEKNPARQPGYYPEQKSWM